MNTVATTDPTTTPDPGAALIPQADIDAVMRLETVLKQSREAIRTAGDSEIRKAVTIARAMVELENAITPQMLADFKHLMNNPLGFKTDRPPGSKAHKEKGDYTDQTIKRCAIVAMLTGAQMTGNEWNLLVENAYFTKEFMRRVVLEWKGLTRFEMELGNHEMNAGNTASLGGRATWVLNGEKMEVVAGMEGSDGLRHAKITVNAYATSSPDEVRGKGESKMLRRVVAKLTGLNLSDDDAETVDGDVVQLDAIEEVAPEPEQATQQELLGGDGEIVETTAEELNFEDAQVAMDMVILAQDSIAAADKIVEVTKRASAYLKDLAAKDWSSDAKEWARLNIEAARDSRVEAIRAKRSS